MVRRGSIITVNGTANGALGGIGIAMSQLTERQKTELLGLVEEFLSGQDGTPPLSDRMIGLIIEYFAELEQIPDPFEDLILALDLYTADEPYRLTRDQVASELRYVRDLLLANSDERQA